MGRVVATVVMTLSAFVAQSAVPVAAAPGQRADGQGGARHSGARTAPAPIPPAVTPPVSPPPVSPAPFQSTLKFEPRQRVEEHVPAPLPLDRLGRPVVPAMPWLTDVRLGSGLVANGQLAYALPSGVAPGGVQLDVQPWRAQVYVDGTYVGVVRDFTGYYHHLEISAGPHVIAIVAQDYDPLVLDVLVSPGRVITYHETLSPASSR